MDLKKLIKFVKDEILIPCLIGTSVALFINLFIGFTFVNGSSMYPTLENKDYLMLNKINKNNIEYGDIVVFDTTPDMKRNEKIYYIKRIIATPGDHLEMKDGVIKINGKVLDEKYTDGSVTEGTISTTIPSDKYFVLGDNRDGSADSRVFGLVSKDDIVGTVIMRLYPFKSIKYK